MAEGDVPSVTEEGLLTPRKMPGSMLERWVQADPKGAIERINTMVSVYDTLRTASIRATYPSDWIVHVSRDADGNIISQRAYLQDIGAERAGKLWGIEVGNPAIEEKTYEDGTIAFYMLSDAWSKVTGERLDYVEGSRWSGDPFFRKSVGSGPEDKIDPTDVRKAAYANLHGRAVRALAGLGGVPVDVLKTAGLDVSRVVVVDYQKGAKGGESTGAGAGSADVVMPYGKGKGQKVADLDDANLRFYLGAYERDVANPEKAQYRKNNERVLAALRTEHERRTRTAAQHAETSRPEPSSASDAASPTSRGQKLADLNTRLSDACANTTTRPSALIRAVTKEALGTEIAALSDLTEEQLDTLNAVPESVLADTAKVLAKGGTK